MKCGGGVRAGKGRAGCAVGCTDECGVRVWSFGDVLIFFCALLIWWLVLKVGFRRQGTVQGLLDSCALNCVFWWFSWMRVFFGDFTLVCRFCLCVLLLLVHLVDRKIHCEKRSRKTPKIFSSSSSV